MDTQIVQTKLLCNHCASICDEHPVHADDKIFCCAGCRSVYLLLEQNKLGHYYELEDKPGNSLKAKILKANYAFLDQPEIRKKLIDFSDGQITKITLRVSQMHCTSCIWLLENLNRLNKAVLSSRVNFLKRQVQITFHETDISLKELVTLMASVGYEPQLSLADLDKKVASRSNRHLIAQIGVAGFAFGNMMLFTFPFYLGLNIKADANLFVFFTWLNIGLILPVIFFSASDYFRSAWLGLKQRKLNIDLPISIGMLTLFLRSLFEVVSHTGIGYLDSLAGLVFFLLIGKWVQQRTYRSIAFDRDYRSYFPVSAMLRKDAKEYPVPLSELKEGDRIVVRNRELIPADGILLKSDALIDYSFVTGEAQPVQLKAGEQVYAGGRHQGQSIVLQLQKSVSQSYLTQLWNDESFNKTNQADLEHLTDHISSYFTPAILLIALLAGLYWLPTGLSKMILVISSVLIVACPCALALSVPFTFGNTLRLFGRKHFYLRNHSVIEEMSRGGHIVFDKTGTLTKGAGLLHWEGEEINADLAIKIAAMVRNSTHPLSRQILQSMAVEAHFPEAEEFEEISGKGLKAIFDGKEYRIGSAVWTDNSAINNVQQSKTYLSVDGMTKGAWIKRSVYRKGLKDMMETLSSRFKISLLSGDNDSECLTLQKILPPGSTMLFNQSPHDKLAYIKKMNEAGEKVIMLGDGLNDAGALQEASVGIAVSEDINTFSPACDAILKGSVLTHIPMLLAATRNARQIVYESFTISFLYNTVGLAFAVSGLLTPIVAAILMPLSSLSVLIYTYVRTGMSINLKVG